MLYQVARLRKEEGQVNSRLEKLHKKVGAADYAAKCPASTQQEDQTKIAAAMGELKVISP